jgi:hypothetical protein
MEQELLSQIKYHQTQITQLKRLIRQARKRPIDIPDPLPPPEAKAVGENQPEPDFAEHIRGVVDNLETEGRCKLDDLILRFDQRYDILQKKGMFYRTYLRPCMSSRFQKVTYMSKTDTLHWNSIKANGGKRAKPHGAPPTPPDGPEHLLPHPVGDAQGDPR